MLGATSLMKVKRKKGTGDFVTGTALLLSALVLLLGAQTAALPLTPGGYFTVLAYSFLFYCGVWRLGAGYTARRLCGRALRLQELFLTEGRVALAKASGILNCDLSALADDVGGMRRYGMVKDLRLDLDRAELVLGDAKPPLVSARDARSAAGSKEEPRVVLREERRRSVLPFYALGGVWCIYAAFLPLLTGLDFMLAGILSLLAFFTTAWKTPDHVVIREQIILPEPPKSTGDTALDELLDGVAPNLAELRRLDREICGKLDGPVKQILFTTEQIVAQLRKNPASAAEMRQFFNYTLPTTIGLLKNYEELSRQPVQGRNINDAMRKIEDTIGTIVTAFHRQLDALFRDKALNIAVELEVMEGMIGDKANPFGK